MPNGTTVPFNGSQRVLYGGLGGLVPLLISAAAIDAAVVFQSMTMAVVIGYTFKAIILFSLGALVGFFVGADDAKGVSIFIKGIAAPALLTTFLNGHQVAVQQNAKMLFESPLVASAYAGDAGDANWASQIPTAAQCDGLSVNIREFKRKEPGLFEELARGFKNSQPDDLYLVVGVFDDTDALCKKLVTLKENPERLAGWRWMGIYARMDNSEPDNPHPHYYIVLSAHLQQNEAKELLDKAIAAGFAGAQIFNPWAVSK